MERILANDIIPRLEASLLAAHRIRDENEMSVLSELLRAYVYLGDIQRAVNWYTRKLKAYPMIMNILFDSIRLFSIIRKDQLKVIIELMQITIDKWIKYGHANLIDEHIAYLQYLKSLS